MRGLETRSFWVRIEGNVLRKLLKLFGIGVVVIAAAMVAIPMFAGGADYNTDFSPPSGIDAIAWPDTIGGSAVEVQGLEPAQLAEMRLVGSGLFGATARYGQNASVTVIQTGNQDLLDAYVETVRPRLEGYSNRSSGKLNGAWWIRGSGTPGRLYGWQRQNWFYLVQAANDDLFDEVVEKLPYISGK